MLPSFFTIFSSLVLISPAFAASAADWSTKSIYQLVTDRFALSNDSSTPCDTARRTYCGGSWAGITNHLDYIQGLGFDAVWISPIVENLDGTAYGDGYHGYWSRDIDTLNPRFGTAADLKNLSSEVHKRGMYLMVDVVVNHYASVPTNTTSLSNQFTFDYSSLLPFGTQTDFHSQCFIQDYTNQTEVEQCWLGDVNLPLPDVNTEDDAVVDTLNKWIKTTVAEFSIDGVRLDTVKHVRRDFWPAFTASAGVFTLGEVLTDNETYAASYFGAVDGVLDYPAWYHLTTAFGSPAGNLSALQDSPALASLAPASASVPVTAAFLENHDQPRFPSLTKDTALRTNAMVWPFVGDGIPTLYYGQEQGYEGAADPQNREALWLSGFETPKPEVALVKALNAARKRAMALNADFLTTPAKWLPQPNPSTLMLSKPPLLTLLTNVGANASTGVAWRIPAGVYAPGTKLVDVLSCTPLTVNSTNGTGGDTDVAARGGMPQVLVPASALSSRGGACPALATGGAGRGRVVTARALAVLGTAMGVVALL